jgi:hypothetical protein
LDSACGVDLIAAGGFAARARCCPDRARGVAGLRAAVTWLRART